MNNIYLQHKNREHLFGGVIEIQCNMSLGGRNPLIMTIDIKATSVAVREVSDDYTLSIGLTDVRIATLLQHFGWFFAQKKAIQIRMIVKN